MYPYSIAFRFPGLWMMNLVQLQMTMTLSLNLRSQPSRYLASTLMMKESTKSHSPTRLALVNLQLKSQSNVSCQLFWCFFSTQICIYHSHIVQKAIFLLSEICCQSFLFFVCDGEKNSLDQSNMGMGLMCINIMNLFPACRYSFLFSCITKDKHYR